MHSRAQGTIEYLVILAVIVVISLVVVALFASTASSPSTQISSSVGKLGSTSGGGIKITDAIIDSQGNAVVAIQNVSGEGVTITKVSQEEDNVEVIEVSFNEQIVSGEKLFYLTDFNKLCECTSGVSSRTCEFKVTYTAANNLIKTEKLTINTQCVSSVTPKDPEKVVGLGTGTLANPWVINSCTELQNMSQHLDGNYVLGGDVNCAMTQNWNSGGGFAPIGPFLGSLDGREHTIDALFMSYETGDLGVFSRTSSPAEVKNIKFTDININAVGDNVGGLTASNYGTITKCRIWGTISNLAIPGDSTGGIAGVNVGTIHQSSFSGSVTGGEYVGGIVGYHQMGGTISQCFSEGNLSYNYQIAGGIVGYAWSTTTDSYSTIAVATAGTSGGAVGVIDGATLSNIYATGNSVFAGEQYGGSTIDSSFLVSPHEYSSEFIAYSESGGITNAYWYSNNDGTIMRCGDSYCSTGDPISSPVSYLYSVSNLPLSNWNFSTIWRARDGNFPVLQWQ